jgi:hypothetical protein
MKTGVDYIYQNRLQRDLDQQFTFSDAVTSNINQTNTCNSLASALLAAPATFTAQTPSFAEDYFNTQLPQLTLNFGLRDEFVPQIHILDNRLANGLDIPNQTYTISASSVAVCSATVVNPCIPGGMGAVPFNNHIAFANNRQQGGPSISDNTGPRLGFAYAWGEKTVVNGGAGIFYDSITARSQWVQNNIEGPTWPWTTGISNQQTNILQNSFWPGSTQNVLTLITNLEGNFPNPVVASSPWLTIGGGYVSQPNYKNQRAVLESASTAATGTDDSLLAGLCRIEERATELHLLCHCGAAGMELGDFDDLPSGYAEVHAVDGAELALFDRYGLCELQRATGGTAVAVL